MHAAGEAINAGLQVAVCSTSNERAVSKIVEVLLGPEVAARMQVFAGDIVPKKKPDPAVYLLAAKELGVDPSRWAVAALLAPLPCVLLQRCSAAALFKCHGELGLPMQKQPESAGQGACSAE